MSAAPKQEPDRAKLKEELEKFAWKRNRIVPAAAGAFIYLMHWEGKKRPERVVLTRRTIIAWKVNAPFYPPFNPEPVFLWGNDYSMPCAHVCEGIVRDDCHSISVHVHEDAGRFSANYRNDGVRGLYAYKWLIFDSLDELKADYLQTVQRQWDVEHAKKSAAKKPATKPAVARARKG
jgi:hypothetical protein